MIGSLLGYYFFYLQGEERRDGEYGAKILSSPNVFLKREKKELLLFLLLLLLLFSSCLPEFQQYPFSMNWNYWNVWKCHYNGVPILSPTLDDLLLPTSPNNSLFYFYVYFEESPPAEKTLGCYATGAPLVLYVPMFPWKYFFFTKWDKREGIKKKIVFLKGVWNNSLFFISMCILRNLPQQKNPRT